MLKFGGCHNHLFFFWEENYVKMWFYILWATTPIKKQIELLFEKNRQKSRDYNFYLFLPSYLSYCHLILNPS